MRRKISMLASAFLIVVTMLPMSVSALGGYFVLKGDNNYHSVMCEETMGYNIEDLQFYATEKEVMKAGYRSSECCSADGTDYEDDGATYWRSKDQKIQIFLELERLFGIFEGYDVGFDECFDDAYEAGTEDGFYAGWDAGYEEAQSEFETSKAEISWTPLVIAAIAAFMFGRYTRGISADADKRRLSVEVIELEKQIDQLRRQ